MSRRRNEVPTNRFNVSLPRPVAERVKALAEDQGRSSPAVIAALVMSMLCDVEDETWEEARVVASPQYQRLARRNEVLDAALTEARRQLAEQRTTTLPADLAETPRWAWPLDCLLADEQWWQRWLPRLHELLGSEAAGRGDALDDRGYVDLLAYLFPPIGEVTWRSLGYQAAAQAQARVPARGLVGGPGRAIAWEPVIRHAALALAALEATEVSGADPFHAIRVHAEVSGSWLSTLRHLLGKSPAELRDMPLWIGR